MVLRTILILVIVYLVFRMISRRFFTVLSQPRPNQPVSRGAVIEDKIIACPACGTYNPSRDALFKDGKHYCNQACFDKQGRPA